jgi:8-oxo-dGTP pyrophosphatase MutT (NUDIX family)
MAEVAYACVRVGSGESTAPRFIMSERQDGMGWEFPGGFVESYDVSAADAARREFAEELAGIIPVGSLQFVRDFRFPIAGTTTNLYVVCLFELTDDIAVHDALARFIPNDEVAAVKVFGLDSTPPDCTGACSGIFLPALRTYFK